MDDFGNTPTPKATSTSKNLVLVFDLDNTIAGKYVDFQKEGADINDIELNPILLSFLQKVETIRDSVSVFLLTNNSDIFYITMVDALITSRLYGTNFNIRRTYFDDIMSLNDERRFSSPKKTLEDIKTMLVDSGRSIENLAERTFFFDDQEHVDLRRSLPVEHYIKITPPFTFGEDITDYSPVYKAINTMAGGSNKRKKSKKTRKARKASNARNARNARKSSAVKK